MPKYPEISRDRGSSGVAVVELELDESMKLTRSNVLEAPDADIKESVTDAVKQWKFKPIIIDETPRPIKSKLTFYFVIRTGDAQVTSPKALSGN